MQTGEKERGYLPASYREVDPSSLGVTFLQSLNGTKLLGKAPDYHVCLSNQRAGEWRHTGAESTMLELEKETLEMQVPSDTDVAFLHPR